MVASTPVGLLSPDLAMLPALMPTTPTRPEIGAAICDHDSCTLRLSMAALSPWMAALAKATAVLAVSRLTPAVALRATRSVVRWTSRLAWSSWAWSLASCACATPICACNCLESSVMSASPALTLAPSATSTFSTIVS